MIEPLMNFGMRDSRPFRFVGLLLCVTGASVGAENSIDFNRDIRPILSDNCFHCHGPDENHREADLRLDIEADAKANRDGQFVINVDHPSESQLLQRAMATDPDERMPPVDSGKRLSQSQIAKLQAWMEQGAPWKKHWAYESPRMHRLPKVSRVDWPTNWIDFFILSRLDAEQLSPSETAEKRTIIRRLSFDLTGLPPTAEQVDSYLQDDSPNAYERLVDRLLASPAFGERMAIYWLDLVRFADTVGYHGDQDHSISPYRDYVIHAFNDNLSFDQFTIEQLAGDLLPNPTIDQQVATGYNRLLQTSHEGGVQPKEYLAIYAADRVRNVSAVWMGGTLGCAQCHDHKYDPYTSKDFYSMVSIFSDIDEEQHFTRGSNNLPTARPPEMSVLSRALRRRVESLRRIQDLDSNENASDAQQARAKKEIERLLKANQHRSMVTVSLETPRTIRLLPRGNWLDDSGPIMEPAVPEFLGQSESKNDRFSRLDLANWLTDPKQTGLLTSRVFVNRLWYLFFGSGLSRSLDDFGGQGVPPVHPELLDNLAIEFISTGWDVKNLIRILVTSKTYQQTSRASKTLMERDPYNEMFARQSRFRLPAEMVRDNALAVSRLLQTKIGGPSVKPYQPAGYYRHLNFPTRKYKPDRTTDQWRRGVYVHWQRQFLHPMLKAFDAPSREECSAGRPQSNTPLSALTLLNDPTFIEAARLFAERILLEGSTTDESRIAFAFRQAVSRRPTAQETSTVLALLNADRLHYQQDSDAARTLLQTGLAIPDPSLLAEELAAWTSVARAILNLNETTIRQ